VRREGAPSPAGGSPAQGVVDAPWKLSGEVMVLRRPWFRSPETKASKEVEQARGPQRVKPEQAPREMPWTPTLPRQGEGRSAGLMQSTEGRRSTGVIGAAREQGKVRNTGYLVERDSDPNTLEVAQSGVGGAHGTDEAGNDRGGTGPWFRVLHKERTRRRLA